MRLKPFIGIRLCPRCGMPMVKAGISLLGAPVSTFAGSRYHCFKCESEKARYEQQHR